jgi:hypothetical protein
MICQLKAKIFDVLAWRTNYIRDIIATELLALVPAFYLPSTLAYMIFMNLKKCTLCYCFYFVGVLPNNWFPFS